MGSCLSAPTPSSAPSRPSDKAALERSKQIDRTLKLTEKQLAKEAKILLLGAGESGKSTVLKQMRYVYQVPFTADELDYYRRLILENLLDGLHQVLDLMDELALSPSPFNANHVHLIVSTPSSDSLPLTDELLGSVRAVWADPAVQRAWSKAHEAALPSNLEYLVQNASRFWAEDFVPTDADILAARATTTGILESSFKVRDMVYKVVDVGGQRSERKKWVNVFSDVNAILFVVSLSGYNECLLEDRDANQMRESMVVFAQLVGNRLFRTTALVLFFNKADLLARRLCEAPLRDSFSDFGGPNDDAQAARLYFRDKFMSLARKRDAANVAGADAEGVYVHFTTATERRGMEIVMRAVSDVVTRTALREFALL